MKTKWILTMLVLACLVTGCAFMRQASLDISEEEIKNAETARVVGANYLEIWPIQSGFIRASLGVRFDELPSHISDAMDELDALADKCNADPNNCTDYDVGASLGYRSRIIIQVIAAYVPEILKYLPFAL